MRLFLALSLPEPLRARLAALCTGLPDARWVAPENLHLTLRFIGEVDGGEARDLDAALAQVRAARPAVTLAGVDRFGSGRKLRALWAGVEPNPELDRLYRKLDHAVRDAGLAPGGRKFKPHVTLARFKGDPGRRLLDYLAHHAGFRAEAFEARDFVLYSSFLSHGGAIYTAEAVYPLSPLDTAP
ncbi:MAG: RNA 2',3'-cyclic phosphodiesterase [Proteobacteria bacterium]|nr:RNA 2',3'-cyclic phosphodiesterase [Pseudomonadota bacterium]